MVKLLKKILYDSKKICFIEKNTSFSLSCMVLGCSEVRCNGVWGVGWGGGGGASVWDGMVMVGLGLPHLHV